MAISSIKYTEYGQQYLTLPLTLKNVSAGLIVVNKVSIKNVFIESETVFSEDYVLTLNESYSDYTEATQLGLSNHEVYHVNGQNAPNKTFKVGWVFSLDSASSFTFQVEFNPNVSSSVINRGTFSAQVEIEYELGGVTQEFFVINITADCSDKNITLFSGVPYSSVSNVFGVLTGNVRNLN